MMERRIAVAVNCIMCGVIRKQHLDILSRTETSGFEQWRASFLITLLSIEAELDEQSKNARMIVVLGRDVKWTASRQVC